MSSGIAELGVPGPAGLNAARRAWARAAHDEALAYEEWRLAVPERRAEAYAAYVRALDREQDACRLLAQAL